MQMKCLRTNPSRRPLHILANIQGMFFNQHIKNIARLQFLPAFFLYRFVLYFSATIFTLFAIRLNWIGPDPTRLDSTLLDAMRFESLRIRSIYLIAF